MTIDSDKMLGFSPYGSSTAFPFVSQIREKLFESLTKAKQFAFSPSIRFAILASLMSGCRDSNPESPVPKTGMLAVTPHPEKQLSNTIIGIKNPLTY
jgi:hypothetical protein